MARRTRWAGAWAAFALTAASCSGGGNGTSPTTTAPPSSVTEHAGSDDSPDVTAKSDRDDGAALARPDINPLNCAALLDLDDADIALGLTELPFSDRNVFQFTQGEVCTIQYADDETRNTRLEPGLPSDLDAGAELLGVIGNSVDGVGDAAAWFETADSGTLAVQQDTELGRLNFRLTLNRPDIDGTTRLDTATEVALRILPRFPGVDPIPPPDVELAALRPAADRSSDDPVQRLLAGEADGTWARGVGLVALLTALERGGEAIDGIDGWALSGTGIVALARDHAAEGGDGSAQQLTALLDDLFPTPERIDAATPTTTTTTTVPATTTTTVAANGFRRGVAPPCEQPISGFCLETVHVAELDDAFGEGKYLLFLPVEADGGQYAGYPNATVDAIIEAFTESAKAFEALGVMPPTDLLLDGGDGAPSMSFAGSDACSIAVRTSILEYPVDQIQQFVAGEMAHCFLAATFPQVHGGVYQPATWWSGGMAIWLSTLVYPNANLEWVHLDQALTGHELQTSIYDRGPTNWMWFQHLQWEYGIGEILQLVGNLPPDLAQHPDFVSTWPSIDDLLHEFVKNLSDLGVPDSGNNQLAGRYDPPADLIEVDAPTSLFDNTDAMRVGRVQLVVLGGRTACIDTETVGDTKLSWRAGDTRETGNWSEQMPTSVRRDVLFAASSATDGGAFRITVTDVVDSPSDCEPDDDNSESGPIDDCPLECGPSLFYSLIRDAIGA